MTVQPYSPSAACLMIPTQFALAQIECIDVAASLKKLRTLQQTLIRQTLYEVSNPRVAITDTLIISADDMHEIFAGDCGDLITSKGLAIIKAMFSQCYLELKCPPGDFPVSLQNYINSNVCDEYQNISSNVTTNRITDLDEQDFSYTRLYYLFNSIVGSKQGTALLNIGGIPVTRTTTANSHTKEGPRYKTVFYWENESCRTQQLSR